MNAYKTLFDFTIEKIGDKTLDDVAELLLSVKDSEKTTAPFGNRFLPNRKRFRRD